MIMDNNNSNNNNSNKHRQCNKDSSIKTYWPNWAKNINQSSQLQSYSYWSINISYWILSSNYVTRIKNARKIIPISIILITITTITIKYCRSMALWLLIMIFWIYLCPVLSTLGKIGSRTKAGVSLPNKYKIAVTQQP